MPVVTRTRRVPLHPCHRIFRVALLVACLFTSRAGSAADNATWITRFNSRIAAANADFKAGRKQKALDGYEAAYQLIPTEEQRRSPQSFAVLSSVVAVRHELGQDTFPRLADLMVVASTLDTLTTSERYQYQGYLWATLEARLSRTADPAADAEVLTAMLRDRGLAVGIVALPQLVRVKQLYHAGSTAEADSIAAGIESLAADPTFTPDLVAAYWSLVSKIATERSRFATAFAAHRRMLKVMDQQWANQDQLGYNPDNLRRGRITAHNDFGWLLLRMGDYSAAERQFETARQIGTEVVDNNVDTSDLLWTEFHLATLAQFRGRYDEAVTRLSALLDRSVDAHVSSPRLAWSARNNLAMNLSFAGRLDDAMPEYDRALAEARTLFGEQHIHYAETLVNQSWLFLELEETSRAVAGFRHAVDVFEKVERESGAIHPRLSEAKGYLVRALLAAGAAPDECRASLTESVHGRLRYAAQILDSSLSERDRLAFVTGLARHTESPGYPSAFSTYLELAPQLGVSPVEQHRVLRAWSDLLSGSPHISHGDPRGPELKSATARLARSVARSYWTDEALDEASRAELVVLDEQLSALERDRATGADGALFREPASRAPLELPPGSALVDVRRMQQHRPRQRRPDGSFPPLRAEASERYVMFIVQPGDSTIRVDLRERSVGQVDRLIDRFTSAIDHPALIPEGRADLDALIGAPIRAAAPDANLIFIAGERAFHKLAFSALGTGDRYWAESTAFVRLRAGQAEDLTAVTQSLTRPQSWLVVGDVDYGPNAGVPRLEFSGNEADAVNAALSQASPNQSPERQTHLHGAAATKAAVLSAAANRDILHLASHGYFRTDAPDDFGIYGFSARLDSGLVLADDGSPAAELFLTAGEIGYVDLRPTRLLVLSACETGLGHSTVSRNPLGMVDAIGRTGARHLVAANWKVPDEATHQLMTSFYRHLLAPEAQRSIPEALRLAQVDAIRSADWNYPYYWSAWNDWYGEPAE